MTMEWNLEVRFSCCNYTWVRGSELLELTWDRNLENFGETTTEGLEWCRQNLMDNSGVSSEDQNGDWNGNSDAVFIKF
jgi:hypothetical protein